MSEGFLMDNRTAMVFFRACRMYEIEDRAERIALMRKIVKRGQAKYIRDAGEFIEGKRVTRGNN